MTKNHVIWVGVAAFLALAWVCIRYRAPMIESDVETLAQARLFAEGLDTVKARAWGRRIILEGEVGSQRERKLAIEKVAGLRVVGKVVDAIQVRKSPKNDAAPGSDTQGADMQTPYLLLLTYDGSTLSFEGAMPGENANDFLEKAAIVSGFQDTNFEKLEIRPNPPGNWSIAVLALMEAMVQLEHGEALLKAGQWQLIGKAAHAGKKRQAEVATEFLQAGFEGKMRIELTLSQQAKVCQEKLDRILAANTIPFESSLAGLTPVGMDIVEKLFREMEACPSVDFQVVGRTISKGSKLEELEHTQSMAETVMAELVSLGIDPTRISAQGMGTAYPIEAADAPPGSSERRIEMIVLENAP